MCCVFQCVKKIQILYVCLHIGHAHTVTAVTVCAAGRTRNKSCKSSTLQSQQKQHTAVTVCAFVGCPTCSTYSCCVSYHGCVVWGAMVGQHHTTAQYNCNTTLQKSPTMQQHCSTLQHTATPYYSTMQSQHHATKDSYRVAKTQRIPYLYRSFSAKVTYIYWLFCGK